VRYMRFPLLPASETVGGACAIYAGITERVGVGDVRVAAGATAGMVVTGLGTGVRAGVGMF
jgi:hypothetical protein